MDTRKVTFSSSITIHVMAQWTQASSAARDGSNWITMAVDRERFRRRVLEVDRGPVGRMLRARHGYHLENP